MAVETAVLSLSQSIMSAVLEVWFSRRKPNQTLAQLIEDQVPSAVERRRLERTFEGLQEAIAFRLMRDASAQKIPENERNSVIYAANDSFKTAALTQEDLLSASMNPAMIAETVRARSQNVLSRAALSDQAIPIYDALLDETASMLVTTVSSLPDWDNRALTYLLRRQEDLVATLSAALERLPSSAVSSPSDPIGRYQKYVISALDRVETVGFPVSGSVNMLRLSETFVRPDLVSGDARIPLDWALADHSRLFLHGPAGSGKTSVLKWLAISAARQSLDGLLGPLNSFLPVYVSLRGLSLPEVAADDISYLAHIAQPAFESIEMEDLVLRRCEAGSALLLFDGLDEIDASSRQVWLRWLADMTERYPGNRFVIASRTYPFDVEWLVDRRFTLAYLGSLEGSARLQLIRQWFSAAESLNESWEEPSAAEASVRLSGILENNGRLDDLARTPLMCTLLCALFRERGDLPLLRADVYAGFIDMLVERRDTERGIRGIRSLPKPEALHLLEALAERMILDGVVVLSRSNARQIIARAAWSLPQLGLDADEALDHLLTRSGVLIEPAPERVQFVHRTFLEFLAARSLVENDFFPLLISRAHDPSWHSVTVLAAAQARSQQGERLVEGLLRRCRDEPMRRVVLAAVLQECVVSMVRLSPSLREECEELWRHEVDIRPQRIFVGIDSGSASELSALYQWMASDDALQAFGSVLMARGDLKSRRRGIVVAADRQLVFPRIIESVISWHRANPRSGRKVELEGGGLHVVIDSVNEYS